MYSSWIHGVWIVRVRCYINYHIILQLILCSSVYHANPFSVTPTLCERQPSDPLAHLQQLLKLVLENFPELSPLMNWLVFRCFGVNLLVNWSTQKHPPFINWLVHSSADWVVHEWKKLTGWPEHMQPSTTLSSKMQRCRKDRNPASSRDSNTGERERTLINRAVRRHW